MKIAAGYIQLLSFNTMGSVPAEIAGPIADLSSLMMRRLDNTTSAMEIAP
jgi:hypothetical protein